MWGSIMQWFDYPSRQPCLVNIKSSCSGFDNTHVKGELKRNWRMEVSHNLIKEWNELCRITLCSCCLQACERSIWAALLVLEVGFNFWYAPNLAGKNPYFLKLDYLLREAFEDFHKLNYKLGLSSIPCSDNAYSKQPRRLGMCLHSTTTFTA